MLRAASTACDQIRLTKSPVCDSGAAPVAGVAATAAAMFTGGVAAAAARVDHAAGAMAAIKGARASGIVAPLPAGRPQASSSSDKGCTSKFGAAGCEGATASASRFNLAIAMVDICKVELMSPTGAASGALPCDS